jgi:hypothetical protein
MIAKKFILLEGNQRVKDEITGKKSKFNTEFTPWKWLAKQLFDYIDEGFRGRGNTDKTLNELHQFD